MLAPDVRASNMAGSWKIKIGDLERKLSARGILGIQEIRVEVLL